jgi:hypothetical protein
MLLAKATSSVSEKIILLYGFDFYSNMLRVHQHSLTGQISSDSKNVQSKCKVTKAKIPLFNKI